MIKKISWLIVLLLIIPFTVRAEECKFNNIKINSINMKDKTEYVEEISEASVDNNKVNLDIKMYEVGDFIDYELSVQNMSDSDLDILKLLPDNSSYYFEYELSGNASLKKLDLSMLNTSSVVTMNNMLRDNTSLEEINMDGFDLSASSSSSILGVMFANSTNIKRLSMKNWIIPESFTNAIGCRSSSLCSGDIEYIDVTNWDLSKTKSLEGLFGTLSDHEIRGLDTFDTSGVENMFNMFGANKKIEVYDLSSFDTSKVTTMTGMFDSNLNLKTIIVSDKFKTDQVTNSSNMFAGSTNIVGGNGTVYDANHLDKEYARIDTASTPGYFTRAN